MAKSRHHHWMVFGVVHFSVERPTLDNNNELQRVYGEAPLNGIITAQHNYINANRMGKAQEALMLRAAQKVNDDSFKVEDVVIHNFSYLGQMTDDEFRAENVETALPTAVESASPQI